MISTDAFIATWCNNAEVRTIFHDDPYYYAKYVSENDFSKFDQQARLDVFIEDWNKKPEPAIKLNGDMANQFNESFEDDWTDQEDY